MFSKGAEQSGIYSKEKLNTSGKKEKTTPQEI